MRRADIEHVPWRGALAGRKRWWSDITAVMVGALASVVSLSVVCAIASMLDRAECRGEHIPFLKSAPETFIAPYCLAKNTSWLFRLKQRLGIYDPGWRPFIK
jgi:hypothetical protein